LGCTWQTWEPVLSGLSARRLVAALDLPGFGQTPPLQGEVTISNLINVAGEP
jgi:pimeloyl-ACP methyl ester carboxylesterase